MGDSNEEMIKKMTGTLIFERGENLYLKGGARDIIVDKETNPNLLVIVSAVSEDIGSQNHKDVYILLNYKSENIEEFSCNCYDFMREKKKRACKHIVAAYLRYLRGEVNQILQLKDSGQVSFNLNYIEKIPNNIKKDIPKRIEVPERVLLNLNFGIDFYIDRGIREAAVELMAGENRLYKILDVREFLNSAKNKNYVVNCENGFVFNPRK